MRRLLLVVLTLCGTLQALAQRPWDEYDHRQQQRIVASKNTPQQVRSALAQLDNVRGEDRDILLEEVTKPTKNRQVASLYLYIYECLRQDDGGTADADVAMLRAYPKYMLEQWCEPEHQFDIYNRAYAVALYGVRTGETRHVNGVIRALSKGSSRRTKVLARRFETCLTVAEQSLALGEVYAIDHTQPTILDIYVEPITKARYAAAVGSCSAVAYPTFEDVDKDYVIMMEECMSWYGGYYTAMKHSLGRNVAMTYCQLPLSAHIILSDAVGDCHTLPWMLYITKDGMLYAISVGEAWNIDHVVVGILKDGLFGMAGIVDVEDGALLSAKCSDDGLYIEVDGPSGAVYYVIPSLL